MSKKSSKLSANKVLMIAFAFVLALFVLLVLIVPGITLPTDAVQWQLDFVQWFVDLKDNLAANYGLYILLGGAVVTGAIFAFKSIKK